MPTRNVSFPVDHSAVFAAVSATLATLYGTSAVAQTETPERAVAVIEEITVTAQRRTQSLQDVPISASVFDADAIQRQNITTIKDYFDLTPNIAVVNTGNRLRNDVGIRGVSNIGGAQNVVGFYVDEFNVAPVSENATYDQQLIDVERIEVLRGPQSTLFGRNAAAGAISITSKKPSDELEGNVTARLANFDTYETRGAVNIPLTETLAIRANGYYEESGGFLNNEGPSDATNDFEAYGARGILRWTPTERFTADISYSYADFEQGFNNAVSTGELIPLLDEAGFEVFPIRAGYWPDNEDTIQSDIPLDVAAETTIVTARLQYDFDSFSLISMTGYIDHESTEQGEADHTEFAITVDDAEETLESWSTELRLQSQTDGAVSWQLGAVYAEDKNDGFLRRQFQDDFYLEAVPPVLGIPEFPEALLPRDPVFVVNDTDATEVTSYAVFGEMSWTGLDDRLTLSAGLRWQYDDVESSIVFARNDPFPPYTLVPGAERGDADFDEWMPRFSATYYLNDSINVYGTLSVGYKPGGYNLDVRDVPAAERTYDSETLTNHELGIKGFFFDSRVRFNAALFYLEWDDIQVQSAFLDTETFEISFLTQNATEAESVGFEAELIAAVTDSLQWQINAGYNDAEFKDFPNALVGQTGEVIDASGNTLPFAPEWTFSSILEYRFAFAGQQSFAQLEYIYRDDVYETVDNTENLSDFIESYEYFNLRAGFNTERFDVVAYVENLTDENYASGFRSSEALAGTLAVVNPRRYGLMVTYNF